MSKRGIVICSVFRGKKDELFMLYEDYASSKLSLNLSKTNESERSKGAIFRS